MGVQGARARRQPPAADRPDRGPRPRRARCFSGDLGGIDDLHDAINAGRAQGVIRQVALAHNELANVLAVTRGSRDALGELERGIELVKRSGLPSVAEELERVSGYELYFALGEWDRLLESASGCSILIATTSTSRPS